MFELARPPQTAVVPTPPASAADEEDLDAALAAFQMNFEGAINKAAAKDEAASRERKRLAQQAKDSEDKFNAIKNAAKRSPLPVASPDSLDDDVDLEDLITQVNQRIEGAAADMKDAAKSKQQLITELEAARAKIAGMERTERGLRSEVQENKVEKEKLKAELATMKMEEEKLVAKLTNVTRENERLSEEILTLKKEKEKLTVELTNVTREKERLSAEATSLKMEKEKVTVELTAVKTEKEKLAAEITTLKTVKEKLRAELTTVKTEKDRLAADLTTVQSEKDNLAIRLTAGNTEKEEVERKLRDMKTEKEEVERQLRDMKEEHLNELGVSFHLRQDIEALQKQYDDYKLASRQKLANVVQLLRRSNALLDEMGCR